EQQVQHNRHQGGRADAGVENRRKPDREVLVELGSHDRNHAGTDSRGHDDQIHIVFVVHLGQRTDAAGSDGAKQNHARATQYGWGNSGNQPAHDGQQAQRDQNQATKGHDVAAFHAGYRHQTDVLGKGALCEGAKYRGNQAGEHIGAQPIAQTTSIDFGVDNVTHGQNISRGFHQRNDDHNEHGDDRGSLEGRHAKVEQAGQGKDFTFANGGEIRMAHGNRNNSTDDNGQQDGQAGDGGAAQLA